MHVQWVQPRVPLGISEKMHLFILYKGHYRHIRVSWILTTTSYRKWQLMIICSKWTAFNGPLENNAKKFPTQQQNQNCGAVAIDTDLFHKAYSINTANS